MSGKRWPGWAGLGQGHWGPDGDTGTWTQEWGTLALEQTGLAMQTMAFG